MKRSLKETVRYNSQLNRERKEERQAYFDLQTQVSISVFVYAIGIFSIAVSGH